MAEIIEHDFGKEDREYARKLARLLRLVDEREADMLANPGKYMDLASRKIVELETFLHELWDTLQAHVTIDMPPEDFCALETMRIDRREYERLKRVERMIRDRPR